MNCKPPSIAIMIMITNQSNRKLLSKGRGVQTFVISIGVVCVCKLVLVLEEEVVAVLVVRGRVSEVIM